jgi:hypothetical protein
MGGGDVVQGRRFHGHYASFNLRDHREIVHINIEKAADIQEQLVTKIAELAATQADVGEAVPLRLDVPATAAAELWDSGLPVAAHERDTLETLAASYHVPLWAVAQLNPVAKNALLTEGQRIIVPRHLTRWRHRSQFQATRRANADGYFNERSYSLACCSVCSRRTRPETSSALEGARTLPSAHHTASCSAINRFAAATREHRDRCAGAGCAREACSIACSAIPLN